jgi:hypothetical protein
MLSLRKLGLVHVIRMNLDGNEIGLASGLNTSTARRDLKYFRQFWVPSGIR